MRKLDQIPEPGDQAADELEDREDRLTRRVTWWVEGPLITVLTLILLYYGGNSGPNGDSHYIDHGTWQDAILWPVLVIGFALLIIDRAGRRPLGPSGYPYGPCPSPTGRPSASGGVSPPGASRAG